MESEKVAIVAPKFGIAKEFAEQNGYPDDYVYPSFHLEKHGIDKDTTIIVVNPQDFSEEMYNMLLHDLRLHESRGGKARQEVF